MKKFAFILAFIFISFLVVPSIYVLIDKSGAYSLSFSMDEEETSSKNQVKLDFQFSQLKNNELSILFHRYHDDEFHYKERNYSVILNVFSPPPELA